MIKVLFFATGYFNETFCSEYYQFIIDQIFLERETSVTYLSSLSEVEQCNETFDVFVYRCREQQNYPWSYVPSYQDVLGCVSKCNPKIIIQLADEFYYENLQEHNQLSSYCKLFLRQFNYSNYEYSNHTVQIPLGYYNDFEFENAVIKPIKDRNLNWSFVGCEKSDRRESLDAFSTMDKSFVHLQQDGVPRQVTRNQLIEIYSDSIFAPCSRGWTQLETNRIYESLICGAIPVLVCGEEEYNVVFDFYGNYQEKPLFIREDSWVQAVERCKILLQNPEELQRMQDHNIEWWNKMLSHTRQIVNEVLNES